MQDFPIYNLTEELIKKYFGEIPEPPTELKIRGTFPIGSHLIFLTVVGSRMFTSYGKQACQELISGLQGYPIVIVSGLAFGIDAIAHQAALDAKLLTIGFPGSGLSEQVITPKENFYLARNILEAGGCLLSEFHDLQGSPKWVFPKRNRLMAGISRATLLVEAIHKSGSRITAKYALEYNRDIMAVPGSIFSEKSEAPNELIRSGAIPITCSKDILEALGFQISETPMNNLFSQCDPAEARVLQLLGSPKQRGDLIRELSMETSEANVLFTQMEMKGLVKDIGGEIRRT